MKDPALLSSSFFLCEFASSLNQHHEHDVDARQDHGHEDGVESKRRRKTETERICAIWSGLQAAAVNKQLTHEESCETMSPKSCAKIEPTNRPDAAALLSSRTLETKKRGGRAEAFLSSFLPFFLSSFLPFFLSSFLPFFLSSFLPFFLSSFLPFFLSSFLLFFLSSFVRRFKPGV